MAGNRHAGRMADPEDTISRVVRRRKSVKNSLAAIASCRVARPDGEMIDLILDNLPAHKFQKIRAWCENQRSASRRPIPHGPPRSSVTSDRCAASCSRTPTAPTITYLPAASTPTWPGRNANARDPEILALERKRRAAPRCEPRSAAAGGTPAPRRLRCPAPQRNGSPLDQRGPTPTSTRTPATHPPFGLGNRRSRLRRDRPRIAAPGHRDRVPEVPA
jgi:hypothetical protein